MIGLRKEIEWLYIDQRIAEWKEFGKIWRQRCRIARNVDDAPGACTANFSHDAAPRPGARRIEHEQVRSPLLLNDRRQDHPSIPGDEGKPVQPIQPRVV